jgi:hypothetical protein
MSFIKNLSTIRSTTQYVNATIQYVNVGFVTREVSPVEFSKMDVLEPRGPGDSHHNRTRARRIRYQSVKRLSPCSAKLCRPSYVYCKSLIHTPIYITSPILDAVIDPQASCRFQSRRTTAILPRPMDLAHNPMLIGDPDPHRTPLHLHSASPRPQLLSCSCRSHPRVFSRLLLAHLVGLHGRVRRDY